MGVKLSLGGEFIALKVGQNFQWGLAYGNKPFTFDLETTTASARKIQALAKTTFSKGRAREDGGYVGPLTLLIEDDENGRKVECKGIYAVVSDRPGADYNTKIVTLADQRWLWARTFVERSYNIRRKTGSFRLIRNKLADVQINRQRADFGYRRATLFGANLNDPKQKGKKLAPWTALDVLQDILQELCGKDGYVIDAAKKLGVVDSIEGLELHDAGPDALQRVLSFIPGARVYIGYDGKAHVGSIYDGTEFEVFKSFAPGNAGDWEVVDKSQMRPDHYIVYSDREVELRFDYDEQRLEQLNEHPRTQVRGQQNGIDGREPRYLENVIINPLYSLQLEEGENPRYAALGEPVPIDDFIAAFNLTSFNRKALPNFDPQNPAKANISKDILHKHWFGTKWGLLRQHTCLTAAFLYNPERLKLLEAIRAHYRTTFRILPQWRDKIRAIKADRAAILDWETGTRAPASVFTQYIQVWTQLGYAPKLRPKLATLNDDYAEDIGEKHNSPFEVSILDSDMGLFHLRPKVDQTGLAAKFVPGTTKDGVVPSADKRNAVVMWVMVDLDPAFKVAVVLTAIQDVPNNEGRLHPETVTIKEAAALLKLPKVPVAAGPGYELVQTAETARYAWIDKDSEQIQDAFFEGKDYPQHLMTNKPEIKALSVSAAASMLVTQLDKVEGRVAGPLAQIEPTGNLRTVTHSVSVGLGNSVALFTTLTAPGDLPPQNLYAQLPEGIRRKVKRLVQP